jgi:hypothetical protein
MWDDIDTSDTKRFQLASDEKQKIYAEKAARPGGLAFMVRFGVVRGKDGKFYFDEELKMTLRPRI